MRALADVLLRRGWSLSGSDLALAEDFTSKNPSLNNLVVHRSHDAENLPRGADLLFYSDAVPENNPERLRAIEIGVPQLSYFEAVGLLTTKKNVVAVAGTHGKSSTSAMIGHICAEAGCDPTVFCGAAPIGGFSGGRSGNSSLAVVEACEFRSHFLALRPRSVILHAVEPDHFDCFPTQESLRTAFVDFLQAVPDNGAIYFRHENAMAAHIASLAISSVSSRSPKRFSFGLSSQADWTSDNLSEKAGCYRFDLRRDGQKVAVVQMPIPGMHNVVNAVAAAGWCLDFGISAEQTAHALASFPGLRRRFEVLGGFGGVAWVDDYAHHPTEVVSALETCREAFPNRRIWCIFQPHQALRTARLLDEFAESLLLADKIVLADIFRAREGAWKPGDVQAEDLAQRVREIGRRSPDDVVLLRDVFTELESRVQANDVILTLGAGDLRKVGYEFFERLRKHRSPE